MKTICLNEIVYNKNSSPKQSNMLKISFLQIDEYLDSGFWKATPSFLYHFQSHYEFNCLERLLIGIKNALDLEDDLKIFPILFFKSSS